MFGKLLGKLTSAALGEGAGVALVDYFTKKQQLKQELVLERLRGKIEVERARVQYKLADLEYDNAWELAQIRNSGWKDEYTLILLSIPLILVFIPWTQPYVLSGFAALERCPLWFQLLLCSVLAATHGIRWWRRQERAPS